ncbi:unnamed protein product [Sphenostylis stenocarpa]|uniref:Uncharacterized protein n=1 Tax=Sphenostylis stenocarpa TaxID=92480 RepID=A0AA86VL66_9FABA|nr:unnamed protein product [Sphenostylis stenocarpa]
MTRAPLAIAGQLGDWWLLCHEEQGNAFFALKLSSDLGSAKMYQLLDSLCEPYHRKTVSVMFRRNADNFYGMGSDVLPKCISFLIPYVNLVIFLRPSDIDHRKTVSVMFRRNVDNIYGMGSDVLPKCISFLIPYVNLVIFLRPSDIDHRKTVSVMFRRNVDNFYGMGSDVLPKCIRFLIPYVNLVIFLRPSDLGIIRSHLSRPWL